MENKRETGDYYRNLIYVLRENLKQLELDLIRYGDNKKFARGIEKNIIKRRGNVQYYERLLLDYIKNGWAE